MTNSPTPTPENLAWRLAVHPETDWDDLLDGPSPNIHGNLALDRNYYPHEREVILVKRCARIIQAARNVAAQAAAVPLHEREAWINAHCESLREKCLSEHGRQPDTRQRIDSDVSLFRYATHVWLLNDCTALGEV